jgi:hypothetical protein
MVLAGQVVGLDPYEGFSTVAGRGYEYPSAPVRSLTRLGGRRDAAAWIVIVLSFVAIAGIGTWNAVKYPVALSYDGVATANYMQYVLRYHRIPPPQVTVESRQPPVYYVVGGLAAHAGRELFGWREADQVGLAETSYRGAQLLNLAFVLLTGVMLLSLARTVAPRSPTVWAAALGFFAFLPVVAKTEAMIHPEPMNMFLSTLAVWLTTKIVRAPALSRPLLSLLVLVLAVGLATRASIVFTAAAIAVGFVARYWRYLNPRRLLRHAWPLAAVAVLAVAVGIWVGRGGPHSGMLGSLAHPFSVVPANRSSFFDVPAKPLFETPFRPHFRNSAVGETYTEIWGDWVGSFAWSDFAGPPVGRALSTIRNQNWIGVLPTLLAVAGYLMLLVEAVRRRRELLPLALVPVFAIGGYLVRSYEQLTPDGDLFKASYILTTAPVWALGFGLAFGLVFRRLGRFRLARVGLVAVLAVFAVLELRFMMYGVRDGTPPF